MNSNYFYREGDYILKILKYSNNELYLENISSNDYIKYINEKYPNIKVNSKQSFLTIKVRITTAKFISFFLK